MISSCLVTENPVSSLQSSEELETGMMMNKEQRDSLEEIADSVENGTETEEVQEENDKKENQDSLTQVLDSIVTDSIDTGSVDTDSAIKIDSVGGTDSLKEIMDPENDQTLNPEENAEGQSVETKEEELDADELQIVKDKKKNSGDIIPLNNEETIVSEHLFIRQKGKPKIESVSFVADDPEGIYALRIINGPENYHRVSSAIIEFNNQVIFSESDFNQQVAFLKQDIILKPDNTLSVKLKSKPGSALGIQIIKIGAPPGGEEDPEEDPDEEEPQDTIKPTIAIIEPEQGALILTPFPKFTITYSDNESGIDINSLKIMINGEDMTDQFTITETQAIWSSENMPFEHGQYTISATISDKEKNTSEATSIDFTIEILG
jgi:hypothetical protein